MPINLNEFSSQAANNIVSTAKATIGSGIDSLTNNAVGALKGLESKLQGLTAAGNLKGLGSLLRSKNVAGNVNGPSAPSVATSSFSEELAKGVDWRVKLSIPLVAAFKQSPYLAPLNEIGGLVFPFTPQISITHSANYQAMEPLHNNYSFFAYQNSKIEAIQITGTFVCEDSIEATYWLGAMHYLRSVTKMFTGASETAGAPPPVVFLNGYGPHVFNSVPVVVTNFTVEMPNDVDYLSTNFGGAMSHVPTRSTISVTVQPVYSREDVRQFSLDAFISGKYLQMWNYI